LSTNDELQAKYDEAVAKMSDMVSKTQVTEMEKLFLETVERLNNRVIQMEKSKGKQSSSNLSESNSADEFVISEDVSPRILPPLPSKYTQQNQQPLRQPGAASVSAAIPVAGASNNNVGGRPAGAVGSGLGFGAIGGMGGIGGVGVGIQRPTDARSGNNSSGSSGRSRR
jgi:hypothetical protein